MRLTIDESILDRYGLTLDEFLILYLCAKEINIKEVIDDVISKKFADKDLRDSNNAVVSNNVKELLSAMIIDSDKAVIYKDAEFLDLAKKMQNLFPEGKKAGTTYYWRGSASIIATKLKTIVTKFGISFTEEEALKATKKYVETYANDRTFMQLLKYFILKNNKKTGELESEFMTILENINSKDEKETDWTVDVR